MIINVACAARNKEGEKFINFNRVYMKVIYNYLNCGENQVKMLIIAVIN